MNRRQFLEHSTLLPACASRLTQGSDETSPWKGLHFGIISDEVNEDFEAALSWIRDQGLRFVEPRNLWGTYVMDLSGSQMNRARDLLAKHQIRVSDIATPYLKATLPGTTPIPNSQMDLPFGIYPFSEHQAILLRAFEKARIFGTTKIRIFSFWRVPEPGSIFDRVKKHLQEAVELAERAGMLLLLENEPTCNVATGEELAAMLREIPSKHFGALWDPGNAFVAGERSYPDGYERLDRRRVQHMHLKDAVRKSGPQSRPWVAIGKGQIDIRGQLQALIHNRYREVVSVETHYIPENGTPAQGSHETLQGLRSILRTL